MKLFGFADGEAGASGDPAVDGPKAEALSAALAVSTAVPWALGALLYNGVHCTYGRDKARAAARQATERRLRRASGVGVGGGVVSSGAAGGGPDAASRSGSNGTGGSLRSPPPPLPRSSSIDGRPGDCATGGARLLLREGPRASGAGRRSREASGRREAAAAAAEVEAAEVEVGDDFSEQKAFPLSDPVFILVFEIQM